MINLRRLLRSFKYAARGVIKTFREEQNLQIQTVIGFLVVVLGFMFKISRLEWGLLVLASGLVILAEIANSAVERIADALKPRIDIYIKEIKDIMAAAVMISSIGAVIIGLLIFGPHFFNK